ncbi:hypothetical protein BKA58DRAFT_456785 [Alternaria rosae]|uniref:uncharacterized protein n=1 Tax=Alternaria rosae TaxID=1187941 RepID=UPI001E8E25DC|nr:uncharacterized protein BKA58DRAFT_456785 [Alternaria rosae]KAH6873186.1 hypothetical protein BKA58DRAFT_456785 [Alternaria rosae]
MTSYAFLRRFIDLSDEEPHLFEKHTQWLYTRVFDRRLLGKKGFKYLAQMYVLGEKLIDHTFQDMIVEAIILRHVTARLDQERPREKVPGLEVIRIIYEGTTGNARVRRLLVDIWAFNMDSSWVTETELRAPANKPFLDDLLPVLLDRRGLPDASQARPWISQRSSYYSITVKLESDVVGDRGGDAISEPSIKDESSAEDEPQIREKPSMIDEPLIKEELSSEAESSREDVSSSEDEPSTKTEPSVKEKVDVLEAFWGM